MPLKQRQIHLSSTNGGIKQQFSELLSIENSHPTNSTQAPTLDYIAFLHRVPFASDAHYLGYTTGIRQDYTLQQSNLPIHTPTLVQDNTYDNPDIEDYINTFNRKQPVLGIIEDAYTSDEAKDYTSVARTLQQQSEFFNPIIVPKCREALSIIPDDIIRGYPVGQSDIHGKDVAPPKQWANSNIHILGGTPISQFNAIQRLTGYSPPAERTLSSFTTSSSPARDQPHANIVGVDWNMPHKMMQRASKFWTPSGWKQSAYEITPRETIYRSLYNAKQYWEKKDIWPNTTPLDLTNGCINTLDTELCQLPASNFHIADRQCIGCNTSLHTTSDPLPVLHYDESNTDIYNPTRWVVYWFCSEACRNTDSADTYRKKLGTYPIHPQRCSWFSEA